MKSYVLCSAWRNRWLVGTCALLVSLVACSTPKPNPVVTPPGTDGSPNPGSPQRRALTDWTIDPEFDIATLNDAETQAWYRRVGLEIEAEKTETCLPVGTAPEDYPLYPSSPTIAACSGIKHFVGRSLSFHVTSLLTLFRLTGDATLLEEVDRVMEIARSRLVDTDGDGYRNFERLAFLGSDDFNLKEDGLAHSFIPEVIYVFKKNAAASTAEHDYSAHAEAWLNYLLNDYEAKWALQRSARRTEGLPQDSLMHPYMELIRYTFYMDRLVPEDTRYTRLRDAMTSVALSGFKTDTTPGGEVFVWSHRVRQLAEDPNACLTFVMATYPMRTMTTFMDLAFEGYAGFASIEATQKLSRTLSESLLEPNEKGFMYKDVGGLRHGSLDAAGRKTAVIEGVCFQEAPTSTKPGDKDGSFRSKGSYRVLPWGFMATFAPSASTALENTEIYRVNRDVYGDPTLDSTSFSAVYIPAAMAFARLYHAGNYTLQ